jgi:predicted nucleic acid-binding protein
VLLPDVDILVAAHREAAPAPAEAFGFIRSLAPHPAAMWLNPGGQHLRLLEDICTAGDARGDLVIAALAIEADATVISYDCDFSRFSGLDWRLPSA